MKATHKQLVKLHKDMGYYEFDVYPDAKITIMSNSLQYKTITGTKIEKGYHGPKN